MAIMYLDPDGYITLSLENEEADAEAAESAPDTNFFFITVTTDIED